MENTNYDDETQRFLKFKGIVSKKISSVDANTWCVKYGVEIVPEVYQIAPIEVFFLGLRVSGLKVGLEEPFQDIEPSVIEFVEKVGDRIPVSDNEDFAYLFPRDLYEKILLFGVVPN